MRKSQQPEQRRVFVRPDDRLIHLTDIQKRLQDGAKLSTIAFELGIATCTLSHHMSKAGLGWDRSLGRPRKEVQA
ncbi:hypothetical protein GAY29_21090 [Azospirillum brasilense]|uniref:hypothetical protein n=1 Tax=Azospirillum brasilense TaxID=192 RepID=UPI00190D36F4|nr:hypothetical protein [Azospirillum brasilense]MBK3735552.1 hypothetical protein [Azospirillum brasilense]